MSVNKAILIGNLGKDPELRMTASSTPVCSFSIATNERRKDQSGNWTDHTEWHNVIAFGKTAENCSNYLKKGRQVYVEGRIQTRKWQDREGKDRYTTEIIANTVQFIGGRDGAGRGGVVQDTIPSQDESPGADLSMLQSADSIGQGGGGSRSFDDDDIPF